MGKNLDIPCNPAKHHRRSIRLRGYDYSQAGAYFVTICVGLRRCLFGQMQKGQLFLTKCGHVAERYWSEIPKQFKAVELDRFVVMPNHIHGILILNHINVGARFIVPNKSGFDKSNPYVENNPMASNQTTLGKIIRSFKARTTHRIRNVMGLPRFQWQRNYYEHIIRNEEGLNHIREYIINNPLQWQFDRENLGHIQDEIYDNTWGRLEEAIYGKTKNCSREIVK